MFKKIILIFALLFVGQTRAFGCALPPDILNEYKIIHTNQTIHIKYTLYTWKYLQNKITQEIEQTLEKKLDNRSLADFADAFILPKTTLSRNKKPITLTFLSGSIISQAAKDRQNYIPDHFIEIEFDTGIPVQKNKKQEYSLKFEKANFRNISNLIHAYIYSDIQENAPGESFFSEDKTTLYTNYNCDNATFAIGNTLEENDEHIIFDLFVDPHSSQSNSISKNTENQINAPSQKNQESTIGKYLNFFVQPETSNIFKIIGLFMALVLGMLHALLPGHAKLFISTSALQSTGNKKNILTLITTITLSHTLFILALASIILLLEKGISNTSSYIALLGASIYFGFGVFFIFQGFKNISKKTSGCGCHAHHHSNCKHSHNKNRFYFLTGLVAGLNPCIDALAIFVLALSIGNGIYAFWIILIFSLGLGFMLGLLAFGAGKLQIFARSKNKNFTQKAIHIFTLVSGMILIGISMFVILGVKV